MPETPGWLDNPSQETGRGGRIITHLHKFVAKWPSSLDKQRPSKKGSESEERGVDGGKNGYIAKRLLFAIRAMISMWPVSGENKPYVKICQGFSAQWAEAPGPSGKAVYSLRGWLGRVRHPGQRLTPCHRRGLSPIARVNGRGNRRQAEYMLNRTPLQPSGLWQGTMIIWGHSFLIDCWLQIISREVCFWTYSMCVTHWLQVMAIGSHPFT